MISLLHRLWNDQNGFLISSELALVSTVGILGMTVGLAEVANGVTGELRDVGSAYSRLDQSYSVQLPNGRTLSFSDADADAGLN